MNDEQFSESGVIVAMDETARWHARDVTYWSGKWEQIQKMLPTFELAAFQAASDLPANPHLRAVVRKPMTAAERPIPVGVVSNNYTLAPHDEVARQCFKGIRSAGVDPESLECELGLTELGEWMNLRIYFPDSYRHKIPGMDSLDLRLECFNSVDGSSRLFILLGWYRAVCANGMVIGDTMVELKNIHNSRLSLEPIPKIIREGLGKVEADHARFRIWESTKALDKQLERWANKDITNAWGKKAACRTYHICMEGHDVELIDPFASGQATEKPVKQLSKVPGAAAPVKTLYDVSQALSWVATGRSNPEERIKWQSNVPKLVEALRAASNKCRKQ